jgi:hypothetical protein
MLDPDSRVAVPGLPQVAVYRDDREASRFYAFAAQPRIAVDDAGRPQLSVFLYRRGRDKPPEGGQVSLTVTLALTEPEQAAVVAAIGALPRRPGPEPDRERAPGGPPAAFSEPTIVPPEWLSGEVTVRLAEGIVMQGRPTLSGDNSCLLMAPLDAAGAAAAERAISGGLKDSLARYAVEIAVARSSSARAERTRELPGRRIAYGLEVGVTEAARQNLDLAGPLSLGSASGADVLTTVGL